MNGDLLRCHSFHIVAIVRLTWQMYYIFLLVSETNTHPVITNYSLDFDGRIFLELLTLDKNTRNHFL